MTCISTHLNNLVDITLLLNLQITARYKQVIKLYNKGTKNWYNNKSSQPAQRLFAAVEGRCHVFPRLLLTSEVLLHVTTWQREGSYEMKRMATWQLLLR